MTKHVLVLCQRNSSVRDTYVQNIVSDITMYVQKTLGTDVTIEYLTDGMIAEDDYGADYKFALNNSESSLSFIETHKEYYSLIILNTCPIVLMNFEHIYNLLIPNGIMVFKIFGENSQGEFTPRQKELTLRLLRNYDKVEELERLFHEVTEDNFGYIVYRKKNKIGGKNGGKNGGKIIRKVKKSRRKNKKTYERLKKSRRKIKK